ncbi:MAG: hypothetical protein AAF702_26235 [Chloroflexota bacterium]
MILKHFSLLICVAIWTMVACIPAVVPWGLAEATERPVELIDLAGTWQLEVAQISLNEDRTFEITGSNDRDENGHGTWSIASDKEIYLRYSEEKMMGQFSIGWAIDTQDSGFGIYGGLIADPDFYQELEKVK